MHSSIPYPIQEVIPQVLQALAGSPITILQAPPGAGKSTVLPLSLLDQPWLAGQKILMLQPRRLAARTVAARLAAQLGEEVGQTVGYRVRFENKVSRSTRLEVLTEGILTRMLQTDQALEGVGLVIFDEFHERSLHADLALALCRESQQILRDDLRLLVMSATLQTQALAPLLGNPPVITSSGRAYPVAVHYLNQEITKGPIVPLVTGAIRKALAAEPGGDLLVFLPGTGEIKSAQQALEDLPGQVQVLPLYGELPPSEQQRAITPDPQGRRKVVLATSIAETSLTIEGITTVIDSGLARLSRFEPRSGLTRLVTLPLSKDSSEQRAGRAGRLGPGACYRLWSPAFHTTLAEQRQPEMLEADLAPLVLELAKWGVSNYSALAWLDQPPPTALAQATDLLHRLGALEQNRITPLGIELLTLPTHPRLAAMLLHGKKHNQSSLAADVAAILEERDPMPREAGADLSLRVELLRKWRGGQRVNAERAVMDRLERLSQNWRKALNCPADNSLPDHHAVGALLAAAYPERIGRRRNPNDSIYRLANGRQARLPDYDPLAREEFIAAALVDAGQGEGRIFMAAPLDISDVKEHAHEQPVIEWDARNGVLVAQLQQRIGDLVLSAKPLAQVPEEQKTKVLCEALRQNWPALLPFTDELKQWQARVMSLRHWRPELDLPDVSLPALRQSIEEWLPPWLGPIRNQGDFEKLDMVQVLTPLLSWPQQQQLEALAPAKLPVPSGSQIALQYDEHGSDPILAARIQELFGLADTPTINEGRIKVMLHLLSPAYRPQQVTQDLHSFWNNTYQEVKRELRIKYHRHFWPDDPWTAEAVRGVKKRNQG